MGVEVTDFPKVSEGYYILYKAEVATGITLLPDNTRYLGKGTRYQVFDSLEEAVAYANVEVEKNSENEIYIFNHLGEMAIDVIKKM